METERLRYFCTIAETESLTKAAEILNISHSGLSKAMTTLQDELREQILRPQGRGLEVTEAGKRLYQKSKNILDLVDNIKDDRKTPKKDFVRVGLAEIFSISITGSIANELEKEVNFYEVDSGEAEVKILEGEIDFAFSFVPYPHAELEYLKVKRIQMGVFYSNLSFKNLPLEEIPFVVPNVEIKNNPLSIKSRDGWPRDLTRRTEFGANTLISALQIVESGRAAVFIPRFVASRLNEKYRAGFQLQEFEIKTKALQDSARDIYLVKKKSVEESAEMKIAAKVVRKFC
jgi:DNA-binding transcriptional LysR family regulator